MNTINLIIGFESALSVNIMLDKDYKRYSIENYRFDLPKQLIRQVPPPSRTDGRLMQVLGQNIRDGRISDMVNLLEKDDIIIFNRTRVRKARVFGRKHTGGKLDITIIGKDDEGFVCFIRGRVKDGDSIIIGDRELKVSSRPDGKRILLGNIDWDYIENIGKLPLPPYIKSTENFEYYQNELGDTTGSIAAPTASLHFSKDLVQTLVNKGVKVRFILLTVGYGTFKSITASDIRYHTVDEEDIKVSEELVEDIDSAKGKVVAVGTTVMRALETASYSGRLRPYSGETRIFIYPGFKFNSGVTHLFTNFHIPESSLLSLVYAFGCEDRLKAAYAKAIEKNYYFYSLGDAMFMDRYDC